MKPIDHRVSQAKPKRRGCAALAAASAFILLSGATAATAAPPRSGGSSSDEHAESKQKVSRPGSDEQHSQAVHPSIAGQIARGAPVEQGTPAPTGKLIKAAVRFHTNDDDKDGDTRIYIEMRDSMDSTVLSWDLANAGGGFPDNSDSDTFDTSRQKPNRLDPATFADLKGGQLIISIHPHGSVAWSGGMDGHDTWKFNVYADLWFDDGSRLSGVAERQKLSEENTRLYMPIANFVPTH